MSPAAEPDVAAAPFAPGLSRDNPWPGLAAFTEEGCEFFFGREAEASDLFGLVRGASLTILFGQSGLGKTSLLQAGLFPRLRSGGWLPVHIRLFPSPDSPPLEQQFYDQLYTTAISAGCEVSPRFEGETLWEYFHRTDGGLWDARNWPVAPALIFDQFEELFTLPGDRARRKEVENFLTQLAALAANQIPAELSARIESDPSLAAGFDYGPGATRIVLSLREDFLAELEGFPELARAPGHGRLRLGPMDGRGGWDVIVRAGGHLLESESVAGPILACVSGEPPETAPASREAAAGLPIEPAILSLVCSEINARRIRAGDPVISAASVTASQSEIIRDFYDRSMADQPHAVRDFVERQLVTPSGFRDSMALERAAAIRGVSATSLKLLVDRRILRFERRAGAARVEIIHDLLLDVVRKSRARRRAERNKSLAFAGAAVAIALAILGNAGYSMATSLGDWPFYRAVQRGDLGAVRDTLDRDARQARAQAAAPLSRLFGQASAPPRANTAKLDSALILASGFGHTNIMAELLGAGASLDAKDPTGFTPLMRALEAAQEPSVNFLLSLGATLDPTTETNRPLLAGSLASAARFGNTNLVALLLAPPWSADPNGGSTNFSALHEAIRFGHPRIANTLRAAGAQDLPDGPSIRSNDWFRAIEDPNSAISQTIQRRISLTSHPLLPAILANTAIAIIVLVGSLLSVCSTNKCSSPLSSRYPWLPTNFLTWTATTILVGVVGFVGLAQSVQSLARIGSRFDLLPTSTLWLAQWLPQAVLLVGTFFLVRRHPTRRVMLPAAGILTGISATFTQPGTALFINSLPFTRPTAADGAVIALLALPFGLSLLAWLLPRPGPESRPLLEAAFLGSCLIPLAAQLSVYSMSLPPYLKSPLISSVRGTVFMANTLVDQIIIGWAQLLLFSLLPTFTLCAIALLRRRIAATGTEITRSPLPFSLPVSFGLLTASGYWFVLMQAATIPLREGMDKSVTQGVALCAPPAPPSWHQSMVIAVATLALMGSALACFLEILRRSDSNQGWKAAVVGLSLVAVAFLFRGMVPADPVYILVGIVGLAMFAIAVVRFHLRPMIAPVIALIIAGVLSIVLPVGVLLLPFLPLLIFLGGISSSNLEKAIDSASPVEVVILFILALTLPFILLVIRHRSEQKNDLPPDRRIAVLDSLLFGVAFASISDICSVAGALIIAIGSVLDIQFITNLFFHGTLASVDAFASRVTVLSKVSGWSVSFRLLEFLGAAWFASIFMCLFAFGRDGVDATFRKWQRSNKRIRLFLLRGLISGAAIAAVIVLWIYTDKWTEAASRKAVVKQEATLQAATAKKPISSRIRVPSRVHDVDLPNEPQFDWAAPILQVPCNVSGMAYEAGRIWVSPYLGHPIDRLDREARGHLKFKEFEVFYIVDPWSHKCEERRIPCKLEAEFFLGSITFERGSLWLSGSFGGVLMRMDPSTGEVARRFDAPHRRNAQGSQSYADLAFDGRHLWAAWHLLAYDEPDEATQRLLKIDPLTGAVLAETPLPAGTRTDMTHALAWDGQFLWHAKDNILSVISPDNGKVLRQFAIPLSRPSGMIHLGDELWIIEFNGRLWRVPCTKADR